MSKSTATLGLVTFAVSVALGPPSFGETDLTEISGLTSPIIADFEVHNCRPATDASSTTICDLSESTLPGGSAVIDSSSGLTCILNSHSFPIWGEDRNNILDFTEIVTLCDEVSAVARDGLSVKVGLSVSVDAFPGFRYAAARSLPINDRQFDTTACRYSVEPETIEGREVASNGWAVLSEIQVSKYTLISFAGKLERATSGMCYVSEANVAIFDGQQLAGIIYTINADDALISRLTLQEGGRVRVFHGAYIVSPIADLVVKPGSITLEPISDYTSYCLGRVLVPNIYGKGILAAREQLLESGWAPMAVSADQIGWLPSDLNNIGPVGAEGCSGTGAAFCSFLYTSNHAELRVTTAGDNYEVVDLTADCRRSQH